MAHARSARRSEIQYFCARHDEDFVHAAEHARGQLAPERIPDAILDLPTVVSGLDRDPLLAVDGLAGHEIFGDEHGLLALGDEDALVLVRLDDDL